MIFVNGNVEVIARFDVSQVQNIQAVWTLNLLSQSITKKEEQGSIYNDRKSEYKRICCWLGTVGSCRGLCTRCLEPWTGRNVWTQGNEENSEKYWRRILEKTLKGLLERNHPRGKLKKGSRGTLREIADKGKMHFETMVTWSTLSPAPICKCSFLYKIKPSRWEDLLFEKTLHELTDWLTEGLPLILYVMTIRIFSGDYNLFQCLSS